MFDKKAEIYKCGKEIFSSKGFKDTNVTDITKMAGIATGTFYNYYASKDKLFMEIYLEENAVLKRSIMETVDFEGDPVNVTQEMMLLNYKGINASPILREWYNRDVFSKIEQNFRDENGTEHVHFMYDIFIDVVKKWQSTGKMRNDIDAEMIMAIFIALITIDTHKDEVGLQYFPKVMDYVTGFVMNGLLDRSEKG